MKGSDKAIAVVKWVMVKPELEKRQHVICDDDESVPKRPATGLRS
jgi:hypothetical protein